MFTEAYQENWYSLIFDSIWFYDQLSTQTQKFIMLIEGKFGYLEGLFIWFCIESMV